MSKELDKDARLFDKPFHVVLIGTGLDILFPKTYNSKIEDVKRRYQQIDGEHYLFLKSEDGYVSVEPPVSNPGYIVSLSYMKDFKPADYFQMYGAMYQDMSDQLPETEVWCKALSVTPALPGTITCQLVLEAKKGTLLMTANGAPKDEIDEFLALAEYIMPYDGEIPKESDKDAYKANTYHPEMNLLPDIDEDDIDEVINEDLKQYEAEDHDNYDNVDDGWNIVVDLTNKEQIRRVINRMIDNFDEFEYVNFGKKVGGEFKAYESEDEELGYSSELPFFEAAAEFPELHKKIIDFIDLAIDSDGAWMDEETPKGLHAAFALAMHNEKYIPKYIELLKAVDMNHEVYQLAQIVVLVEKWKDYDNGMRLLGARCMSASGQHGRENLGIFLGMNEDFLQDDEKKEKFLKFFMLDVLDSHYYMHERYDNLMEYYIHPILESAEIDFDEMKLEQVVKVMNEKALPGLEDIA